jgi:regulator of sigma E protease
MESILQFVQTAASFLAILTILVFVHEWGHYIIARINGVRVEIFSVGFGPEIWGFNDKNGTRWKFSWVPLGGYVKFFGDASEASTPDASLATMSEKEREEAFHYKKLHQKAAIVFAGPAVNFLFAILIFAGLYFAHGRLVNAPVVGDVIDGSAAAEAGIIAGDRIVSIDGEDISTFNDISIIMAFKLENEVDVVVRRDEQLISLNFELGVIDETDILGQSIQRKLIGIRNIPEEMELVNYGLIGALWQATIETKEITTRNLTGIWQMIIGKRSVKELGGPITIARVAGKTAEYGINSFLRFAALISIGLGTINLFPIPVLDGGHLLYYAIEAVRRKKMSEAAQEFDFKIEIVLVLSLMVFATFIDISRLG